MNVRMADCDDPRMNGVHIPCPVAWGHTTVCGLTDIQEATITDVADPVDCATCLDGMQDLLKWTRSRVGKVCLRQIKEGGDWEFREGRGT